MKEKRTRQAALRWISAICIVTAVAAVVGAGGRSDIYPGEAWTRFATPEDAGFDSTALAEAKARFDRIGGAAGLLVRDGSIVVSWGEIDRRFFASSLRKSLLHALLGVAVHENLISLDATIADLGITDVGGLTPAERSATVADLLTSRSGIYHPAAFEDSVWSARKPDRGTHEPGEAWFYNNWDFNALGTIYEQATGASLFERFEKQIAAPLEMEDFRPIDTAWFAEPELSEHPAYLLRISTRDLARFGLLYASGGEWQGDQIVPSEWVLDGFSRRSDAFSDGTGYGRLWWTARAREVDIPFASGAPGQRMYVMPEHRLVFVFRPDT
jgi:CubicO group peptidase (beta-lactamase class C family)